MSAGFEFFEYESGHRVWQTSLRSHHFVFFPVLLHPLLIAVVGSFQQFFVCGDISLRELKFRTEIPKEKNGADLKLQRCVLDTLGASRMGALLLKNEDDVFGMEYTITGSDSVVENLKTVCTLVGEKEKLKIKISLPQQEQPIQSDQISSEHVWRWKTDDSKCIVISLDNAAMCMACLHEHMEPESLYRFHLLSKHSYVTLLVFFGIRHKIYQDKCTNWCQSLSESDPDKCMKLVNTFAVRMADASTSSSNRGSTSANSILAVGGPSRTDMDSSVQDVYPPFQCLQLKSSLGDQIADCRLCLVENFGTALVPSDRHEYYFYMMNLVSKKDFEKKPCHETCGEIEYSDQVPSKCLLNLENHRVPFPADDQFLARMPSTKGQETVAAKLRRPMSSGCVWGQREFNKNNENENDNNVCSECILEVGSVAVMDLSDATVLTALQPLETRQADERKLNLAKCVTESMCSQLIFIPNAMCFYQMSIQRLVDPTKKSFPAGPNLATSVDNIPLLEGYRNTQTSTSSFTPITATNTWDHPTSSAHQNHLQYVDNLHLHLPSRRNSGGQSADIAALGDPGQTLNLFPVSPGFKHTEKLHQSSLGQKDHRLAASRDSGASTQSHITNVRTVKCPDDSVECLLCLARYGEMLLFSTVYFYAWLISSAVEQDNALFAHCKVHQEEAPIKLDIHPWRPMSYVRMSEILSIREYSPPLHHEAKRQRTGQ